MITTQNTLPDIDDCPPFGPDDEACFADIRQVLEKHGKLQRFGLTLLHQHFDVASDEILLETCDPVNRTLMVTPQPRSEHPVGRHRQTNWRLDSMSATQECTQICSMDSDNNHCGSSHL